jgi:hypothetical protein
MRSKPKRCAILAHSKAAALAGLLVSGEERLMSGQPLVLAFDRPLLGDGICRSGGFGGRQKVGASDGVEGVRREGVRREDVAGWPSAMSSSLRVRKSLTVGSASTSSLFSVGAAFDKVESLTVFRSEAARPLGVSGPSRLRCFCDFISALIDLSGILQKVLLVLSVATGRILGEGSGVGLETGGKFGRALLKLGLLKLDVDGEAQSPLSE